MQVPTISPLLLGSLRGLGVVLLAALLTYMGNTANLPFLSPEVAGIVAALAAQRNLSGSRCESWRPSSMWFKESPHQSAGSF